jgi:hypothetical protein
MTPKEKARELVHIFYISLPNNGGFTGLNNINSRWDEGKKCALIAVNVMLKNMMFYEEQFDAGKPEHHRTYWEEVKTEIEIIK